jgi:succinate dehydrogenase/fumarate reductase cytochrome b subunit
MARDQIGKRLFSLSGIVPLGFFLLEHTWTNASAMRGQDAYVATVDSLSHIPLLGVVEVLLVFLPLAYHATFGTWMLATKSVSRTPSPLGSALSKTNRISAAIAIVFIAWHLWETRVNAWRTGIATNAFYSTLAWRMSSVSHGLSVGRHRNRRPFRPQRLLVRRDDRVVSKSGSKKTCSMGNWCDRRDALHHVGVDRDLARDRLAFFERIQDARVHAVTNHEMIFKISLRETRRAP